MVKEHISAGDNYKRLLDNNRKFVAKKLAEDPMFFHHLAKGQSPDFLWVGCSDSRVPANEITGTESGEIFVHRNVANIVDLTDMNFLSVLHYSVDVLKVRHIIVCGHYGCGGVLAAMGNTHIGVANHWLTHIKDVYNQNRVELESMVDEDERGRRLVELNVLQQVKNLAKIPHVQKAWKHRELQIHGWVYGLSDGILHDLDAMHDGLNDIDPIYRYDNL
ncbi:MAG: carbonate dehydratase [Cryomorphaceae bacterium BACL7 MAG-121220-bin83]|jgi:carbonic anhydrase|nr:MAG: carbonate dehydratase [Cryomorphaceae bacterium BACL7 MAG-121220-bin83]